MSQKFTEYMEMAKEQPQKKMFGLFGRAPGNNTHLNIVALYTNSKAANDHGNYLEEHHMQGHTSEEYSKVTVTPVSEKFASLCKSRGMEIKKEFSHE